MKPLQFLKGLILNFFARHSGSSKRYWDLRWRIGYDSEPKAAYYHALWRKQIAELMAKNKCGSVLDVGCGKAWLRELPNYLGMDNSQVIFKRNGLSSFLVADATLGIPLPSKSFDVVVSCCFLMHLPPEKATIVADEMKRVAKRFIVLKELTEKVPVSYHCFNHDYDMLFGDFSGERVMLEW